MCYINKRINETIRHKRKEWRNIHEGKLNRLFENNRPSSIRNRRPIESVIHNFSSYILTVEEKYALPYGLDHHIPSRNNSNMVKTEFEAFFYKVNKQIGNLLPEEADILKTKMRRTCENYVSTATPHKESKVLKNLIQNKNIMVIKQDKGRGVVLLDKGNYIEKCLQHLNTDNFIQQTMDKTQCIEEKVQRKLRKVKSKMDEITYNRLYPSGSNPGRFYGTAKVHKLNIQEKDDVSKLTLRPIISNIGTATYETAHYLSQLLSLLGKSAYTVNSTEDFISKIKNQKAPPGYQMYSFDVKSLFTNVPLKESIEIVLNKIFVDKLIKVPFSRNELKELLMLCTKEVQFTFQDKLYTQSDGVSMGSPLAPLLANVYMCELENRIIPQLANYMTPWYRYVDDTFAFIDPTKIYTIVDELNAFHHNIQFTFEKERENQLPFLDVLVNRLPDGNLSTTVYRKPTNTNLYINWNSFSPESWKIGTLRNMTKRAASICSNRELLSKELTYIEKVFIEINDYPPILVRKTTAAVMEEYEAVTMNPLIELEPEIISNNLPGNDNNERKEEEILTLSLPYAGSKGENLINKLKKDLKQKLPKNVKTRITYKADKLQTRFQVKDQIKFENKHNVTYLATCEKCGHRYIGETKCRCKKRVIQHNKTDKNSHLLKHAKSNKHKRVWLPDFKILNSGYTTNFKRKISESLYIKEHKPEINIQKDAYILKRFY